MINFNKIILILCMFFIISMISVTHATHELNETLENDELLINYNNSFDTLEDNETSNYNNYQLKPEITIVKSEDIPIKINSPVSGEITVCIDSKYNSSLSFEGNEVIKVPTYDPLYFSYFDTDFINLDVGIHNVSFLLYLNTDDYYTTNFSIINSYLTIDIIQNYSFNLPNYSFNFPKYEINLNVIKKNKTVHILDVDSAPISYILNVKFKCDNDEDEFCVIVSKEDNIIETWLENYEFNQNSDSIFEFEWYDIKPVGKYNITVVNLKDGTSDSAPFNVYNEIKLINSTYRINNDNMDVYIELESEYNTTIESYVWVNGTCLHSIMKNILVNSNNHNFNFEFNFNNLLPGKYEFILSDKWYIYSFPFEIKNNSDVNYSNYNGSIDDVPINITLNNTEIVFNSTFDDSNSNISIFNDKNNSDSDDSNHNGFNNSNHRQFHEKNKNIDLKRNIGDLISSSSQDDSIKSYELSKKSVSKSVKNIYTTIGLIILFILSFLIGYFKFRKNIFS